MTNQQTHALIHASVMALPDQATAGFNGAVQLKLPAAYRRVSNIVVNGMGGSGLAGHLTMAAARSALTRPFLLTNSYDPAAGVGPQSLFVVISYSGDTEEATVSLTAAARRGARVVAIARGGALVRLCRRLGIPIFTFDERFNPSRQPRLGLGYTFTGLLGILSHLGLVRWRRAEFGAAVVATRRSVQRWDQPDGPPAMVARELAGRIPLVIGAEHLEGNAHVFANQFNEMSKTFATYFCLPELNHHLFESFAKPPGITRQLTAVLLTSTNYRDEVRRRFVVTERVMRRRGIRTIRYRPPAGSALAEAMVTLGFSGLVNYHLARANRVDPIAIPWVDFFKRAIAAGR